MGDGRLGYENEPMTMFLLFHGRQKAKSIYVHTLRRCRTVDDLAQFMPTKVRCDDLNKEISLTANSSNQRPAFFHLQQKL